MTEDQRNDAKLAHSIAITAVKEKKTVDKEKKMVEDEDIVACLVAGGLNKAAEPGYKLVKGDMMAHLKAKGERVQSNLSVDLYRVKFRAFMAKS